MHNGTMQVRRRNFTVLHRKTVTVRAPHTRVIIYLMYTTDDVFTDRAMTYVLWKLSFVFYYWGFVFFAFVSFLLNHFKSCSTRDYGVFCVIIVRTRARVFTHFLSHLINSSLIVSLFERQKTGKKTDNDENKKKPKTKTR